LALNNNGSGAKARPFAVRQQAIIAAILARLKAKVIRDLGACQGPIPLIAICHTRFMAFGKPKANPRVSLNFMVNGKKAFQ
jgi:hypothetical protein